MTTKIEVFEQIIRQQSATELLPFLLELAKKDTTAVREKTRKLQKELSEHRQLGMVTWGQVGTNAQLEMLFLAGLSTYSQKEALAIPFVNELWRLNQSLFFNAENGLLPPHELFDVACQLLTHRRPDWLDSWLGNNLWQSTSASLDFVVLLKLETLGFITLSPRLLALSGVGELVKYGTEATMLRQLHGYTKSNTTHTASQALSFSQLKESFSGLHTGEELPAAEDLIYERLAGNKNLLERAIPLFFEFDTQLEWATVHVVEHRNNRQITWHDMLARLAAAGHLDRADLLTRCLLALRRDFRRPLLTWFKELFLALKPTLTERLARQSDLVELLAHPLPLVVNFAIGQLKNGWLEPGFNLAPLLHFTGNLLTRPDLKTGLKTLLAGLTKLPKQDASHAPAVARLLAAALAHPDTAVQEPAAKGLTALLNPKKPVLSADELLALTVAIQSQAELLGAAARALLAPWLAAVPATSTTTEQAAGYAPSAHFVPDISPATAIVPVADWHELLFLTGEVLRHDDPAALERWLDGLLRLHRQLPASYAEQLVPYLVQVRPFLQGKTGAQAAAILAGNGLTGHAGLAQALLLSWAQGFTTLRVPKVNVREDHAISDPLVLVEQHRLLAAEQQLHQRTGLPLLSTPTHTPHWVAPTTLVARLLAYEAAGHEPAAADLAVALARTAYAHAAEAAAAQASASQLQSEPLRHLLHWFLAASAGPLPATAPAPKSLLKHVAERLAQLLPGEAAMPDRLADAWLALWAVAARTRFPEQVFEGFRAYWPADYPGLVQPWVPAWQLEARAATERQRLGSITVITSAPRLHFPSQYTGQAAPSPLLLYSLHARFRGMAHASWLLSADYSFLAALLPHNAAPLHWHVLRTAAWTDKLESSERGVLGQALRTLLGAGPPFAEPTTLVLAAGLLHHTPGCRALALEVLLSAVGEGRLLPGALGQHLGRLLAIEYAPLARLTHLLPQALAVTPETDDALAQTLDALLPELPTAPLRHLRHLLDFYADLRARTARPVPIAVQAQCQAWQATPALQKASAALLAKDQ